MCYSAMIQADYDKYVRHFGATMSLEEFAINVWSAPDRAKKKRRPKAMEDWLRDRPEPEAQRIWQELLAQRAARETELQQELFKQKKRLADAERSLLTKTTKKAAGANAAKAAKTSKGGPAKKAKATKRAAANGKPKKLSAIDAAAKVLVEAGEPMGCREMVETMANKGYWKSPGGKTPHATLYSAILREITGKGKDARFAKTERGKFAAKKG